MNNLISILFVVAFISVNISCGNIETQSSTTSGDSLIHSGKIDFETENRYAYLQETFISDDELYIKVDYVDYLTGKKALEAEWRDHAYFIDGIDTVSNITNGYYISNVNPKIRTFKIDPNAKIENIIDDNGSRKMAVSKLIKIEQLNHYIKTNTLLFIHVRDGVVQRVDERFIP